MVEFNSETDKRAALAPLFPIHPLESSEAHAIYALWLFLTISNTRVRIKPPSTPGADFTVVVQGEDTAAIESALDKRLGAYKSTKEFCDRLAAKLSITPTGSNVTYGAALKVVQALASSFFDNGEPYTVGELCALKTVLGIVETPAP